MMRFAIPVGLLFVFLSVISCVGDSTTAGDRADRLSRLEQVLAEVLDRTKRIEARVCGEPTPAPAIEADAQWRRWPYRVVKSPECDGFITEWRSDEGPVRVEVADPILEARLEGRVTEDKPYDWSAPVINGTIPDGYELRPIKPFDPTAPLPVNPKTGRSALVEAMEQNARDFDAADERAKAKAR